MQRPACCYTARRHGPRLLAGGGRGALSAGAASRVRPCLIALFILKAPLLPLCLCVHGSVRVCVCMHAVDRPRKGSCCFHAGRGLQLCRPTAMLCSVFFFLARPRGRSHHLPPPPPHHPHSFTFSSKLFRREKRRSPWACSVVRATIASPPPLCGCILMRETLLNLTMMMMMMDSIHCAAAAAAALTREKKKDIYCGCRQ